MVHDGKCKLEWNKLTSHVFSFLAPSQLVLSIMNFYQPALSCHVLTQVDEMVQKLTVNANVPSTLLLCILLSLVRVTWDGSQS